MKYDIIIIGAGAAGLLILKELSEAGYHCCLLEAQGRAGGRIHTVQEEGFDMPLETGAEFIHGKLPITLGLLKKANIGHREVGGEMISIEKGKWLRDGEHEAHWPLFMEKLKQLDKDITIGQFLDENFPADAFGPLRNSVRAFAEGFDLADISNASAMALFDEWKQVDDQHLRVEGGYGRLVDYLLESCRNQKCELHFRMPVHTIVFTENNVKVYAESNREFHGARVILTVSAGVLQVGAIDIRQLLPSYEKAIDELGFGTVIKFFLQFRNPIWKEFDSHTGFILSDQEVPTWWTQTPAHSNLLTGWLGGPIARSKSLLTQDQLYDAALRSLATVFQRSKESLQKEVMDHRVFCWSNHPFVQGGYSYCTVYSSQAKIILSHPIHNTLFFAGEAVSGGESQGTVEAAFDSAVATIAKIKASFAS